MALTQAFPIALCMLFLWTTLLCRATPVDDPGICQTPVCQETAKFLLDCMDTSVDPCDDFYQYACGGWIEKHPIPEGKDEYSIFSAVDKGVRESVIELLTNTPAGNHSKPVRDAIALFQGCMNEDAREAQGLDPLKNALNSVGGWPMINQEWSDEGYQWHTHVATIRRLFGVEAIISVDVNPNPVDNSHHTIRLSEPAFGIGDEYLKNMTSDDYSEKIEAYRKYIISVGKLMNPEIDENALANDADEIIQFESGLTQANYSVGELKTVNPWFQEMIDTVLHTIVKGEVPEGEPVSEVQQLTKNTYFQWTDFLNIVFQDSPGITDETKIILRSRTYLVHAIKLASETDPRTIANYIGWTTVRNIGSYTTKDFKDVQNTFDKEYRNITITKPDKLKDTCLDQVDNLFMLALGRLYVDKYITIEAKHEVEELIEDIRSAYEVNFIHSEWMDPETKSKALEKLRNMKSVVGYPEWIKNDAELTSYYNLVKDVNKDEYFMSLMNVQSAKEAKSLMEWNQPSRRDDIASEVSPVVVNAFYIPSLNIFILPAAVFNPPIYRYGTVPAFNHAGIGSYAAHEMGHGFDNHGSRYDKEGNLANWWSKDTKAQFEEKIDCLRDQYSSNVEPLNNISLNGAQTLGDDIADNAGARHAYMAYKLEVLQSQENEIIGNVRLPGVPATPEQLFFIVFAINSCSHHTKEGIKFTLDNDEHSPDEYRVVVPLSNYRGFSEAFKCPLGSRMNPESKCPLW